MAKENEVKYKLTFSATTESIKTAKDEILKLNDSTEQVGSSFDALEKILKSVSLMGAAAAFAKVGGKAMDMLKDISQASQAIETYEVSLKNMLGTTDAARERMQEYFAIAKETPFDLPQVVEAGNKLQALGRYSADNVKMLGDLAAASGKPMEQAMSAYAKLASGQKGIAVDMFRDLMITTDDWAKATGKGVDKQGQMLATTEEMIAALPGLLKSKDYLGMMATQAQTTAGKLSNLEDGIFQLKVAIGDRLASSTKGFATQMGYAVDKVKKFVEIPVEQKIAAEKAELNALVGTLTDSNTLEEQREDALRKLNARYPDFMKNLGDEVSNTEKLKDALAEANKEYDKKMKLAVYQRMSSNIDDEMSETLEDLAKWQASKDATEKLKSERGKELALRHKIQEQAKEWLRNGEYVVDADDGGVRYRMGTDPNTGMPRYHYLPDRYYSTEQHAELLAQEAVIKEYERQQKWFGVYDEEKIEEAQRKFKSQQKVKSNIQGLIDELADIPEENGDGGAGGGNNGGSAGSAGQGAIEKAAAAISGGGKSVKTFNITIGSILGENTNIFQSSTDSPETAQGFLEKLSNALQMVVNDVNYAAQ